MTGRGWSNDRANVGRARGRHRASKGDAQESPVEPTCCEMGASRAAATVPPLNCCSRTEFLQAVREHFPAVYDYAVAAYDEDTLLLFAGTLLASHAGVQQGDPLGPLFFSLALALLLENVGTDGLELNARYLDDGTVKKQ
jgi:hypothetical protein